MSRLDELRAMRDFIDREIAAELGPLAVAAHKVGVVRDVADLYEVTVEDMIGGSRLRRVCHARQGAAWLLKRGGMSHRAIAKTLGWSDHTTCSHAIARIDRDPAARALLLGIEAAA